MQFEHLIEINDPGNPLIPQLTRMQIWNGLMLRAEDARPFVPGLQACTIIERSADFLRRRLDFAATNIHDRVSWEDEHWICFAVEAESGHAGGTLTISIEEPEAGHLFLRFAYHTTLGEASGDPDAAYADFVRSAYHAADIDTVRVIRTLAAEGRSN